MNPGRVQSTGDEKSNDLKQLKRDAVFEMFWNALSSKNQQKETIADTSTKPAWLT